MLKNANFIICTLVIGTSLLNCVSNCLSSSSSSIYDRNRQTQEKKNDNILWRLFTRGKSFLFGKSGDKNSSRRTDHHFNHHHEEDTPNSFFQSHDDYEPPEHRIVNDVQQNNNNQVDDSGPELKEGGGGDGGSGGWGWTTSTSYTDYGQHMQLYTLLGGLSFASFLATALVVLTRRNGTIFRSSPTRTKTVANYLLNGNRKDDIYDNGKIEESHEMFIKVPEFVYKLNKILSPWWHVLEKEEVKRKQAEKEVSDDDEPNLVPVKVTKVPTASFENW